MVGCDAEPDGLISNTGSVGTDPTPTDTPTTPTEPPAPTFGPAVVVDDLHVASLFEEANAFSLIGLFLDPLIAEQISGGSLVLGLEMRGVEDAALQDDDAMSVGMYQLVDDDADPSDNFVPGAPETFSVSAVSMLEDGPAVEFVDGVLNGGHVLASGVGALDAATLGVPLPVSDLELEGDLVVSAGVLQSMEEGRLRGAVAASLLALSPNLLSGTCPGATLLDVFVTGCGLFGQQPDADRDGDGLERFYDDDDDGLVDRCVDGDGTELLGTECPQDPAIADGYTLVLVVHGVAATLAPPTDATTP